MTLLSRLLERLRLTAGDDDLRAELEYHREMRRAGLEADGLSAADADRISRQAMGNLTLAREDARAMRIAPWIESIGQDARYAVRTLRRAPAFAAAMILVTALGISATTAIFGLIDRLVLADLPVREPARLVWFKDPAFSYPIFTAVRARSAALFSGLFAWNVERRSVQWREAAEHSDVLAASGGFYTTLGVRAVVGRTFGQADDRPGGGPGGPVAVISDACWQRRFARDPAAVGSTVQIDRVAFTIIGVAPAGFFGVAPGLAPDLTIPLTTVEEPSSLSGHSTSWLHLMGRLRDGLTLTSANSMLQGLWPAVLDEVTPTDLPRDRRAMYLGRTTALQPGSAGFSRVRNQFEEPLWILLGLGSLLSTAASASAASLLLSRSLTRRREMAVRVAIGASRARVVRQCLVEATVWTAIGAAIGVVLASWSAGALVAAISTWRDPVALDVSPNFRTVMFAALLALATAWLSAAPAALGTTSYDPSPGIKRGHGSAHGRRWTTGNWLVVGQVALTIVLLAGASLFVTSVRRVVSRNAGFDRDNVLVVAADARAAGYRDGRQIAFYDELQQRLARLPGVVSASLSWYPPISDQDGQWTESVGVDGAPPSADPKQTVHFNAVSPAYFSTMGIRLLAGRDFTVQDNASAPRVAIVNESIARRFFAGGNALARRISIGRDRSRQNLEIVGIVSDAAYQRLEETPRRIAYLPCAQLTALLGDATLTAEVRATPPLAAVAGRVALEIAAIDRRVPLRIETVTDRIDDSLVKERIVARLAILLGLAALALAGAATYGLLACAVSRRRKELGVRVALGAGRATLLWMILRQSLALAMVGSAAGLVLALALGRFVRALLFQIEPTDPTALVTAVLVASTGSIAAALVPAYRAAHVDPLAALKED